MLRVLPASSLPADEDLQPGQTGPCSFSRNSEVGPDILLTGSPSSLGSQAGFPVLQAGSGTAYAPTAKGGNMRIFQMFTESKLKIFSTSVKLYKCATTTTLCGYLASVGVQSLRCSPTPEDSLRIWHPLEME